MILIPVRVAPSGIHGLGLFTTQTVPRGTPVWRSIPGFDQAFTDQQVAEFPQVVQDHIRWFGWKQATTGCWILSGDHACFMNHDPLPNTGMMTDGDGLVTVALKDLAAGEELTCDYWEFDAEAVSKLGAPSGMAHVR